MKFQMGDRVLILHSSEEGEIIDLINDKMVMVDVEGVKFPVYIDQIDFPYFKTFSEKKLIPDKKSKKYVDDLRAEKHEPAKIADGVWLTFLPVTYVDEFGDELVEELKLHLINRTDISYKFTYTLRYFGKADFDIKNEIHPFQDFYLHDIAFENLNDSPSFELGFELLQPQKNKVSHREAFLRLKPKQLFAKIEETLRKNEATFSHLLFDKYPDFSPGERIDSEILMSDGSRSRGIPAKLQTLEPARSVVDLHIEKITDTWHGMSNHEIVMIQLETFEKYCHLAVAHMQPSLTVIHGVGSGRLRDEIHELLKHKKEVKTFVNQYHPAYGYGATEIYFKY